MFLCFWTKIAGTNIDGWACSVLFLLCCCFCLCCVNIIATPDLIFYTFSCLNNFCSNNYSVKFNVSVFLTKNAGVTICCLSEFWGGYGECLLMIKLSAYIMWGLIHVMCVCYSFSIFWGHACPSMMFREFSRPPGGPNHTYIRPPLFTLPIVCVITYLYTYMYSSAPIYCTP